MKKVLAVVFFLMFAWVGIASAHGPSRQKVTESIEINAAPAVVWNIIKDFGNAHAWMPMVAGTTSQGGNEKGATRELTLKKGGVVKEELKSYDAEKMSFQYKIHEVDPAILPVANYSATITVEPSGSGSKVEWHGAFYRSWMTNNPPPEQNEEAAIKAVSGLYKESLANLKALAEKQ